MATSTGIKFYSQSLGQTAALSKSTTEAGSIVFDKTSKAIYVSGVKYGSNVEDATFSSNKLTITKVSGGTIELDFSTLATTSSVMAAFDEIKNFLTMDATAGQYVAQADESYVSSTTLTNVNTTNVIDITGSETDMVDEAVAKVDRKAKAILGEVIAAKKEIDAVETGAGLGTDGTYTANTNTNYLKTVTSLKGADEALDAQLKSVSDTVAGLTSGTVTDVEINGGSVKNGTVAEIAVEGTYDDSTNKIATQSTVSNAINALDTQSDVQAVVYTAASGNDGAKLTFKGVSETNGVIAQGSGSTDLQFAKVATTGTAEDVSITDINNEFDATTVEGALEEIAKEIDGMDLNATALMTKTDDTTNGNTTFTISGIQERDGVVSLASGNNASFKTDGVYSETSGSENLIATKATVTAAVNAALDSEVTFQGVTSSLPANPTNGDMYKASGAITIPSASAGEGSEITTKAGDTIIYKNVSDAQNNGWYIIPSGDESFTDTWRAINVNGTEVLGSGISTGDVDFVNGTLTTVSSNNGEISINHAVPTAASGSEAALKFQVDSYGHVVGTSALTISDLNGLSSVTHGTDGDYVTVTVGSKSNDTQAISAAVTVQQVSTADSSHMGLAEASDVKSYVDTKVGTAVQTVDGSTAEKAKSVTQSDYATVKVSATTDASHNVTLDSAVGLTVQAVGTADASNMGLAEASNVKSYVDAHTANVTNAGATIPVNSSTATTIATVDGTNITAKASFTWEEYE